jgi:mycothiol synthase
MVSEGSPGVDPASVSSRPHVVTVAALDDDQRDQLTSLVASATAVDRVGPLSEHALLHLRADGGPTGRHLLALAGDQVVGVAHVDVCEEGEPASAELVVRPDWRRRGLGTELLQAAEATADGPLHVWSHGNLAGAQAFAMRQGYAPVRELWLMTRSLTQPLPQTRFPDGFSIRPFRPGEDDATWLAVNAAAFAHHPEQGAWTSTDLSQRIQEPWFDASGFLLLVDDTTGALAGFHWTKVHADVDAGEVYVVGVAPQYQGRGLAKPLTLAGLAHLRDHGLPTVMLYVDGDNTAAVRTYSGLGFTRAALDVQYARP